MKLEILEQRARRLDEILDSFPNILVAYSGGTDSACLLRAAQRRLGKRALGVIADSPSLPRAELRAALELARSVGVEVEVAQTREFENPDYLSNPVNRCYFCKRALFEKMEEIAAARGYAVLAYGENADDATVQRPGSKAAAEFEVRAPLKEAGLTKADVRTLSSRWGLATADKPAAPCLSSRIPHGTEVTPESLARVELGEERIRALGFRVFRLRHHGNRARIEFASEELGRARRQPWQEQIVQAARTAGYSEVEIDPRGYERAEGAAVILR